VTERAEGKGVIDTYTIIYRGGSPAHGVVIGHLKGGERFIARTCESDAATVADMISADPLGRELYVVPTAKGNQFAFSQQRLSQVLPSPMRQLRDKYEYCLIEKQGRVLEITINRPEVKNCLHPMANEELAEIMDVFLADEELWIAILTGAGAEAFCTGNDLKYSASGKPMWVPLTGFAGLTSRRGREKPVIAAVNGFALGGGLEICLACDLVVADERAQLGLPETRVGLLAGAGGVVRLPRQIPPKIATEMLLTGKRIGAEEALRLGLINRMAPVGQALQVARSLAVELLECSPTSIQLTLRAMHESATFAAEDEAAAAPLSMIDELLVSEDCLEGIMAFAQKRKPQWKGR
jgi:enoyl-CoA hydratase/carnithine racemase